MTLQQWLRDTAERAGVTLLQSAIVLFPLLLGPMNTGALNTVFVTLLPVVVTIVLNALLGMLTFIPASSTNWLIDMLLRVVRTSISTLVSLGLAVGFNALDLNAWRAVLLTVGMAIAAVVKASIVSKVSTVPASERISAASILPKAA